MRQQRHRRTKSSAKIKGCPRPNTPPEDHLLSMKNTIILETDATKCLKYDSMKYFMAAFIPRVSHLRMAFRIADNKVLSISQRSRHAKIFSN